MSRKPEQIVEDQVRSWSLQQKETDYYDVTSRIPPVVTISREAVTPGQLLAEHLGARTGFSVWDKELLQAVARDIGSDEKLLATLDERRRKIIDDTVRHALLGVAPTHYKYLGALMRIIRTIASHGRCIIVGRGAHYICDPRATLRVRLVAPMEMRVTEYVRSNVVTEKHARQVIELSDAEQADFIRYHFRKDITRACDYDLTLNAGSYTVDQMVELVLDAFKVKFAYSLQESQPPAGEIRVTPRWRHPA